jgi:CBS domain containing-hemolysin-like protein
MKNILNLNNKSVEDIMVSRAEIVAVEKNQSIDKILLIFGNKAHSRMPVYEKNLDNTLGFFHIKDLIKSISNKDFQIDNIIREVLYVAPKSPILDLLKRMRFSRIHMGLVVDEFGGVDGLVTIEDLVEEIVGEIEDEHDADDDEVFIKIDEKTIVVEAAYKIEELEKYFGINITLDSEQEIDTVGGMLIFIANKVPKNNQSFTFNNELQLKVVKASDRRIITLEIKKIN